MLVPKILRTICVTRSLITKFEESDSGARLRAVRRRMMVKQVVDLRFPTMRDVAKGGRKDASSSGMLEKELPLQAPMRVNSM